MVCCTPFRKSDVLSQTLEGNKTHKTATADSDICDNMLLYVYSRWYTSYLIPRCDSLTHKSDNGITENMPEFWACSLRLTHKQSVTCIYILHTIFQVNCSFDSR
jgi:hypothetical protein